MEASVIEAAQTVRQRGEPVSQSMRFILPSDGVHLFCSDSQALKVTSSHCHNTMTKLLQAFFLTMAGATEMQLVHQVEYLKAENQILRSKLPKRIIVRETERQRLIKLGKAAGSALKHLISIVSIQRFNRWTAVKRQASRQSGEVVSGHLGDTGDRPGSGQRKRLGLYLALGRTQETGHQHRQDYAAQYP
jgi:hypothetical protein